MSVKGTLVVGQHGWMGKVPCRRCGRLLTNKGGRKTGLCQDCYEVTTYETKEAS